MAIQGQTKTVKLGKKKRPVNANHDLLLIIQTISKRNLVHHPIDGRLVLGEDLLPPSVH